MAEQPAAQAPGHQAVRPRQLAGQGPGGRARRAGSSPRSPRDGPANRLGLARWLVDAGEPADGPRGGQPLLGAALRRRPGRDRGGLRHPGRAAERIPSCSTGWRSEFRVELGWDVKGLLRELIVTVGDLSAVVAGHARSSLRRDPQNRLLARGPRFRLEAEMVRDQALAVGGLLSRKMGGPPVFPPQPEGLWQAAFNGR